MLKESKFQRLERSVLGGEKKLASEGGFGGTTAESFFLLGGIRVFPYLYLGF